MLTGRQPVYKEKEKKHQGSPALVYPRLNYRCDLKMGRIEVGGEGAGIIFFDEEGCSKREQKMYICTARPPGLTSHNFAHLFLFVPRASCKAVLQPTKWRKRREGEKKKGGGGALPGGCRCRLHDPCNAAGILMPRKVFSQTIHGSEVHGGRMVQTHRESPLVHWIHPVFPF